jgi:hypothetical protein
MIEEKRTQENLIMTEAKKIWIIAAETDRKPIVDDTKRSYSKAPTYRDVDDWEDPSSSGKLQQLNAEDLKNNMDQFLTVMQEVFDRAEKPLSKMQLDELELSVEINGEGQVILLGTGGKAGAKGAIKLKFKRKDG